MGELDSEVIRWLNKNKNLMEWLLEVERKKMWGKFIIVYQSGKICGFDISSIQRITLDKNK